jgi:hypothetical protein
LLLLSAVWARFASNAVTGFDYVNSILKQLVDDLDSGSGRKTTEREDTSLIWLDRAAFDCSKQQAKELNIGLSPLQKH